MDNDFAVLSLDTETGEEKWFKLKHNTVILRVSVKEFAALPDYDYSNTRVIVTIKNMKEKALFMQQLGDRKFLAIEPVLEVAAINKKSVDLSMNFKDIVTEYLKMTSKTDLQKKIFAYLDML